MSAQLLRSGLLATTQMRCGFLRFLPTNVDLYTNQILIASAVLRVRECACRNAEALVKQAVQRNPELGFFVAEIAAAKGACALPEPFEIPN